MSRRTLIGLAPHAKPNFFPKSRTLNMNLKNLLQEKRDLIVKKWCDVVLSTYPEQSRKFLKKQKDAIANPVGNTIFDGVGSIYDELLSESESDDLSLFLDNVVRVRAVQDFSPSRAVSFVFGLKSVIRQIVEDELEGQTPQGQEYKELIAFEARIDALALRCFDVYTQCREKIFDIRVNELRTQSARLLKLAGLVCEIGDKPEVSEKTGE